MRVYVETNFILELVYEQKQVDACEQILSGAERGALHLRYPAFCSFEAADALQRRIKAREKIGETLRQEAREIARQKPFSTDPSADPFLDLIARSIQRLEARLELCLGRLSRCGQPISLGAREAELARSLWGSEGLENFDALVMGCICADLERSPTACAIFANRNSRDFATPSLKRLLGEHRCSLINEFDDAVAFLRREQHLT